MIRLVGGVVVGRTQVPPSPWCAKCEDNIEVFFTGHEYRDGARRFAAYAYCHGMWQAELNETVDLYRRAWFDAANEWTAEEIAAGRRVLPGAFAAPKEP